jgi:serine/threonine protein kinase
MHKLGFVHKDIKPVNIMMSVKSTPLEPKCYFLDFGISQFVYENPYEKSITAC